MSGYIKDGKYYKGQPDLSIFKDGINGQYKGWDHDRQRENHRLDLLQPYTSDGKPSQEFIDNYPEEARTYGFIKGD